MVIANYNFICNPGPALQESPGPSGPGIPKESPKSLGSPRGPKSVRNSLKAVSGVSKQSILRPRRLFLDCFEHFLDPGPEGRGRLFGDSFGIPGPEGPGDSCKGRPGLQNSILFYFCLFACNFWRVCSQFLESFRNSV